MITQAEIDATAKRVRELGVPDSLNRWLTMTPTKLAANEAAKATIAKQQEGFHMATIGKKEQALRDQRKGTEPGALSAMAKDVTNISMAELNMTPPKTNGRAAPAATAKPEAKPQAKQEKTVKTKQKKTPSNKARTRVKAGAKTKAAKTNGSVRPGSKLETIVGLLKRPEGCTTKDVLKATGWPAVSMPQQAKAAGLTLKKEKDGPVTRYRAA